MFFYRRSRVNGQLTYLNPIKTVFYWVRLANQGARVNPDRLESQEFALFLKRR